MEKEVPVTGGLRLERKRGTVNRKSCRGRQMVLLVLGWKKCSRTERRAHLKKKDYQKNSSISSFVEGRSCS